jgi:WD40 repeat protein
VSRALVRWHPRRWRERYAEEMLDVLDQHRASPRTAVNLAFSVVSTHVDRDYRAGALSPAGLRRIAVAAALALSLVVMLGAFVGYDVWKDGHWHPSGVGGVTAMAFSPANQRILLTATSVPMDGVNDLWDVSDLAQPRKLAEFEGGAPATFSPDGAVVATVTFSGQPALWDVADPARPRMITTLATGDQQVLWGEAYSPDGRVLATAFYDRLFLWDVASPARPRLLRALAAPLAPLGQQSYAPGTYYTGDIAFSADGRLLAAASGNDQVALFSVADPARAARLATMGGGAGFVFAVAFSPDGRLLADVSYLGTARVFSIADPARPRLAAAMPLVQGRAPDRDCGCFPADYALAFGADGRTLTAIEDIPVAGRFGAAGYPDSLPPWQKARDYIFTWDVTRLPSARLLTSLARDVAASTGNSSLPLIAPRGQAVASGASFGFFGVSLRPLPLPSP